MLLLTLGVASCCPLVTCWGALDSSPSLPPCTPTSLQHWWLLCPLGLSWRDSDSLDLNLNGSPSLLCGSWVSSLHFLKVRPSSAAVPHLTPGTQWPRPAEAHHPRAAAARDSGAALLGGSGSRSLVRLELWARAGRAGRPISKMAPPWPPRCCLRVLAARHVY